MGKGRERTVAGTLRQLRKRSIDGSARRLRLIRAVSGRIALTGLPLLVGWSVSGTIPAQAASTASCEIRPDATTRDYLSGFVCPPDGFAAAAGYEPELVRTSSGWRYVRPASDGADCSGPLTDVGSFWDFTLACGAHDYGYDLVRFGEGERIEADAVLYEDMLRSCRGRGTVWTEACKALAEWAHAALAVGDLAEMEPTLGDFDR
jgi:hypothetical protein